MNLFIEHKIPARKNEYPSRLVVPGEWLHHRIGFTIFFKRGKEGHTLSVISTCGALKFPRMSGILNDG